MTLLKSPNDQVRCDLLSQDCRRELTLYSLNAAENSGPLKQRRFPEDYRRDSKNHVPARTPPANRLSGLAVTDRPFSLSALKVTIKIHGVKLLEGVLAVLE
ncbi:hypothetical protein TSAR_005496 [Trichomalopsis sarcophagae]|uniref:Uncharacterized protein n=1 Tax=Trichomalopsis sarcophagae TaxID=543379 RepID=A0A232FAI6_9HYME|nr:hypothetical protein TSAR_005496 [Trichomalopsis sarcophagae]